MKEYKYQVGDIVFVWINIRTTELNYGSFKLEPRLQGFGKVIFVKKIINTIENYKYESHNIKLRWIKIKKKEYNFKEKDKGIYNFLSEQCTLLIKAKDTTGKEDWKSLLALVQIKL